MSKTTKVTNTIKKAPATTGRVALPEKNGIKRPTERGKTAMPWNVADKLTEKFGRPALRSEVLAECEKKGCSPGMATSQFQNWRVFNGIAPSRGGEKTGPKAKAVKAVKAPKAPAKKTVKAAKPAKAPKAPKSTDETVASA